MSYQAIIFDFDGTLADTLEETRCIFNQLAPHYGLRQVAANELEQLRNYSLTELLDHLKISKLKVPSLLSRGTSMLRERMTRIPLIAGMAEVLPELSRNVKTVGILTSNATENVELFLEMHGLREHFTFVSSTSKLTGKAKHLRAIRKTFSLQAQEMLYVGDEIRDIRASQKAGVDCAAVTWGFNSRDSLYDCGPTHVVDAPQQLLGLQGRELD